MPDGRGILGAPSIPAWPRELPAPATEAYRNRIRVRFTGLYSERQAITAQLTALAKDTAQGNDATLLDELPKLPELAGRLDELPERLQAELFAAFDIQILWNPPMRQATCRTRPGGDPAAVTGWRKCFAHGSAGQQGGMTTCRGSWTTTRT